jgi:hypothetical protein
MYVCVCVCVCVCVGTKKRSKGLSLSFGAWMTHRWGLLGGVARTGNRFNGEGVMQWETDSEVGMEGLDVSFNPSGSSLTGNGRGLCSMLRCEDALVVYTEDADETSMSLVLNGASREGENRGDDRERVRVSVASSEVLAATEFALVVHSLLSQGSELLSLPAAAADKLQTPATPQPAPGKPLPVKNKNPAGNPGAGRPCGEGREMKWKLMRHKIEIQEIQVVFLDDLTLARRVAQPIAMLSIRNFSLVHALRDYVDQVHLDFSLSVAGLETPGSLLQPLCREPLLEECSWSLSVVTDGIAGSQKVSGRCDRVVQIALASSYVRHLARLIDTTSRFLESYRDLHFKMHEHDLPKEKIRDDILKDQPLNAGSCVDEEDAYHEQGHGEGAHVRSALDQQVWIKIESAEGAREVSVPARGNVMLAAAGFFAGNTEGKSACVSLRIKTAAARDWSDAWTPSMNAPNIITCVGGDVVRSVLLAGGAMGNWQAGEVEFLVLCPAFRFHNTLPLDLAVSLHPAPPEDGQEEDDQDANLSHVVQTLFARAGQTVGFSRLAQGGRDAALSATMAGFDAPRTLARLAADLSHVYGNLILCDQMGRRMVLRLTMGHTVAGTVPTVIAHVPMVFVNRTGLPLVIGYRWSPKAEKEGKGDKAVGPGQGSRLILAAGMEDGGSQDGGKDGSGNAATGEHNVDEEWVRRDPQSVPLSPLSLGPGSGGEEGSEELGVALRGSPFWTFLGRLAPEAGAGMASIAGGTIAPGTASAIRIQDKDSKAVYDLGVQVDMGSRPLQRTMYITVVPLVTILNRCGEALEVRYHVRPPNGEDRGSKSGAPGVVVAEGKLRVLHKRVDVTDSENDGGMRQGSRVEVRVVGSNRRPLSLWSGPCSLARSGGNGVSVRLAPPENAKEGSADRHLLIEVKTIGAALFAHVRREEEETCLYSVDNMSGYVDVSVWQKGSPLGAQYGALVETGQSKAVALDCPDLPPVLIIQPAMLDPMEVDLATQGAHGVLPTRDGSDTYIHWVIALKGRRRVVVLTSRVGAEALDEYNRVEWDGNLQLPGVALSLVTNDRVELLHAMVSGIDAQAQNTLLHLKASLRISKAQVDNQTLLGPPTAFLSPAASIPLKTGPLSADASFLLLEAELSHQVKGLAYWKRVSLEAGPLLLQLQEDWLYQLLHFEKDTLFADPAAGWEWLTDIEEGGGAGAVSVGTGVAKEDELCLSTLAFILEAPDPGAFLELFRLEKALILTSQHLRGFI